MKVLMLEVSYYSAYSEVTSYMLLPMTARGLLFSEDLPLNETIESVVDLGEIDGKHSECYGDLKISVVDLDKMGPGQAHNLIKCADSSNFEVFLEEKKYSDEWTEEDNQDCIDMLNALNVELKGNYWNEAMIVDAFENLLQLKYKETYKTIQISAVDFEKLQNFMNENGIKFNVI